MKKSAILVLIGTGLFALTACSTSGGGGSAGGGSGGGGSNGSGGGDLGASAGESLTDYADLETLLARIQNNDTSLTPEDTSTRTGSVSMTGAVGIEQLGETGNLTLVGDLAMTANFDTDTATGSATGFTLFNVDTEQVEADVTGTVPMSNGTISGTDFDANMNGNLSIDGGTYGGTYGIAAALDGRFYDDNGRLVVGGAVTGNVTNPDSTIDSIQQSGFVATE